MALQDVIRERSLMDDPREGRKKPVTEGGACLSLDAAPVQKKIEQKFPAKITRAELEVPDPFLVIDAGAIVDVATYLRDEPELAFDMLHCHAAVDYLSEKEPESSRIEVVLHLTSLKHRHWIVLKVILPRDKPKMPTLEGVWPTANWHEREAYDLFGIEFVGHSDLASHLPSGKTGLDTLYAKTGSGRTSGTVSPSNPPRSFRNVRSRARTSV